MNDLELRLQLIKGYFIVQELVTKRCYELLGDNAILLFDLNLLISLVKLRKMLNCSFYINNWCWGGTVDGRGYRDNFETTGSKYSMHRVAKAFDFVANGLEAQEIRDFIIENAILFPLIKRIEDNVSWVHIDTKDTGKNGIYLFKG